MTATMPPRDWTDICWPDMAAANPSRWIAVLPLAATEQHGPHLPVGTDVMIARAYLDRVLGLLPEGLPATFLPLQPIGISTEHVGYPGTLTLPTETALKSWMALGTSVARAGVKKLVIVTSHGGNSAAMTLVAQDLRASHGLLVVTTSWSRFGVPDGLFPEHELRHGIHGGAVETSIMLARYPQQVRQQAIADSGQQVVLVLEVPVQRHRRDLVLSGQPAERDGGRSLVVGDGQRAVDDLLRIQAAAALFGDHVDKFTP